MYDTCVVTQKEQQVRSGLLHSVVVRTDSTNRLELLDKLFLLYLDIGGIPVLSI